MNKVHPLVSIIIPTYNRAHLIGETLDSVLAQTYQNWECIVVDDGSTDNTAEVVGAYLKKDPRFQYHHRPADRPKGANACRNYGFELSRGEYVNWFDSDDIMFPENIEEKLKTFTASIDFVIANSINFNENGTIDRPFNLNYELPITPENFITGRIGWITNDVLIKKSSVKLLFDEKLHSGQEYNFFSRLLFEDVKGDYVKKDLSKRRIHESTTQNRLNQHYCIESELLKNEISLLLFLKDKSSSELIQRGLRRIVRFSYNISKPFSLIKEQVMVLENLLMFNQLVPSLKYGFWIILNLTIGRGYFLIKSITDNYTKN